MLQIKISQCGRIDPILNEYARAMNKNVHASEIFPQLGGDFTNLRFITQINGERRHSWSRELQRFGVTTEEAESRTLGAERQGDGLADTAAGAGDHRNLVRERAVHYTVSFNREC